MHQELNRKYMDLCAKYGIQVKIETVDDPKIDRHSISEQDGIVTLLVSRNVPSYLGYEKILVWGVRDVLLPRLRLETERLFLRRFCEADKEICLPLVSDKEDCFMDCSKSIDEKNEEYYERVNLFIKRDTQYAVFEKKTGTLVGIIYVFLDTSRAVDAMEIGYGVVKAYQRQGYATEMVGRVLDLLQDELLVDTMSAGASPENVKSMGLLKKLGFQAEGIRHHAVWHEVLDQPVDMQYFYRDRKQ